jgi:hypothetical protein
MTISALIAGARAGALLLAVLIFFSVSVAAQIPDMATPPWSQQGHAATAARGDSKILLQAGAGGSVTLVPNGATRRQVLDRLFAERGVEIEWRNKPFADEKVYGRFNGTPSQIARMLLARRSHIITYDTSGEQPRIVRIYILGPDPPSISGGHTVRSTPHRRAGLPQSMRTGPAVQAEQRRPTGAIMAGRQIVIASARRMQ